MEKDLEQVLFDFVKKVADGKTTSDTEIEAMPKVAAVLVDLILRT